MPMRIRCSVLLLACLVTPALMASGHVSAQVQEAPAPYKGPPWSLFDATGYGALGLAFGTGFGVAAFGDELDNLGNVAVVAVATSLAGVFAGARIGARAQRQLAQHQPLRPVHRAAVSAGVVLAGAALGTLASIPLANAEVLGSDEETVLFMATTGIVLGSFYVWSKRDQLGALRVGVSPTFPEWKRYVLQVQIRH